MKNDTGNIISKVMKAEKDANPQKVSVDAPADHKIKHQDDYTDAFISNLSSNASKNKTESFKSVEVPDRPTDKRLKLIKAGMIFSFIVLIASAAVLKKDTISNLLKKYKLVETDTIKNKEKKLTILESKVSKLSEEKEAMKKKVDDIALKNTMLIKQTVVQKKQTFMVGKETRLYKKENEDLKTRMQDMAKLLTYYKDQSSSENLAALKNKNNELNSEISKIKALTDKINKEREMDMKKLEALTLDVNTFKKTLTFTEDKLTRSKVKLINTREQFAEEKGAIHYNLGYFYKEKKMFKESIEEYNTALKFAPDDPDIHYNMAVIYDDFLDENDLAVEHYKKYLELSPEASDLDSVKEWMEKAQDEG